MTWRLGALILVMMAATGGPLAQAPVRDQASTSATAAAGKRPAEAAFFIRSLDNPRERREARADILDTPVLPGSVVKAVALVAALDSGSFAPMPITCAGVRSRLTARSSSARIRT